MLKNRNLSSLMRPPQSHRRGMFSRQGLLLTMLVVIALTGVAVTVAQSASLKPEAADTEGGGMDIWVIQRADYTRSFWNMSDRSMAKDSSNRMHVAYGGEHLYHAYFDGSSWQTEMVDSNSYVGQYASIAIYNNNIHISYYDANHGFLKYARKIGAGGWDVFTVDMPTTLAEMGEETPVILNEDDLPKSKPWVSTQLFEDSGNSLNIPSAPGNGGVGMYSSIAVDSYGNPHIAYYDAVTQKLKYASYTGVAWTIEYVRQTSTSYDEGKYVSLAFDRLNRPHLSFLEDDHDNLRYAYKEGNNWRFAYPDEAGNVGGYTSILVDNDLNVHISYCQGPLTNNICKALKYVTAKIKDSKPETWTWNKDTVDSGTLTGTYSSIAKSGKRVYISYLDGNNLRLKVATLYSGEWSTQTFDSSDYDGYYTSIAIDSDGRFRVAYMDLGTGVYRELYYNTTQKKWLTHEIDYQSDVGESTAMTLDSADRAHISYMNETSDDLKYATNSSGAWVTGVISSTGDVGIYSSIAVDAGDVPHVAYYDIGAGDLEYATLSGGNWVHTTVDRTKNKNMGLYPDIVISPANNLPYISYYNATDKDLMLANFDGSQWYTQTVDSLVDVGKFTSIDMDAAGHIYISYYDEKYYDGETRRLKFAYYTGFSWMISTVDWSTGVGLYSSIDVDNLGQVHIAYYDETNKALKYALGVLVGPNWTWTIETVDDQPGDDYNVGKYTSVGANSAGVPYISYYDAWNGDLKMAYKPGLNWILKTVDSVGDVGWFTSLDIDSTDYPHISYYDNSFGDLKYAYLIDPPAMQLFLPFATRH